MDGPFQLHALSLQLPEIYNVQMKTCLYSVFIRHASHNVKKTNTLNEMYCFKRQACHDTVSKKNLTMISFAFTAFH